MFRNILRSLITKGLVALINFLLLIISARYLGVSSRGEISIFVLNIAVIQAINEIYTGYTLIYFVPRVDLKKLFFSGLAYTVIFCSLSNAVVVLIQRQIPGFEWMGYVISLLVLVNTFQCVLILGKEKVALYNRLCLQQPVVLLLGLCFSIFIAREFTFKAYVYPLLASFVIATIISGVAALKLVSENTTQKQFELKPVLTNGLLYQAGLLAFVGCNRYSYYLLADRAEIGLFASAVALTESVLIIMNGILPVLLARTANASNTPAALALSLSKASLLLSAAVLLFIFLLPESVYVFVLGKGFSGIRQLIVLYAPGVLLVSGFGIISGYFSAIGRPAIVLIYNALGFACSLLLAPFLVQRYHASGAAITACIANAVIALAAYSSFFAINKLPLKQLFSIKEDYNNLKKLIRVWA